MLVLPRVISPDCWAERVPRTLGWRCTITSVGLGLIRHTNRMVDDNYITIAHGRDYRDCMLDIGIFSGCNVQQHQWVNASVHEQEL